MTGQPEQAPSHNQDTRMKSLSKQQDADRADIVKDLHAAADKIEQAVAAYNQTLEQAKAPVEAAIEAYNEAVARANEFANDLANDIESFMGERSEKWQESDKGQSYQDWLDEWRTEFDEVEANFPDELEVSEYEAADTLEGLPTEPGGI